MYDYYNYHIKSLNCLKWNIIERHWTRFFMKNLDIEQLNFEL